MLAALALLLGQDQSQVKQTLETPGFRFSTPPAADIVTQSANGQVYFVELRSSGQESSPPYLKLFSLPNPAAALDAATIFNLSAQEFASLAAAAGLTPGTATDEVLSLGLGEAASRLQVFADSSGNPMARARTVILQTSPMAAGAMLWQAPGQPDSVLAAGSALLASLEVLPFADDALQTLERDGARFALPLLWTREQREVNGTLGITSQGPAGTVLIYVGAAGIFGGSIGESLVLDEQPAETHAIAAAFGGSVFRQNALMRLAGEQIHVGQRYLLSLPGGGMAELRNAVFSNEGMHLCLLGAVYTAENRPTMVSWLDRLMAAVELPGRLEPQIETRVWSGICARFPARMAVEERSPAPFLPGGWVFTIPHDDRPDDRSFEARIWREDPPAEAADAQKELQASIDGLLDLWPGSTIQDSAAADGEAFGQPAALLQATLMVEGVALAVDARRVVASGGIYRSLAYFPADLQQDHGPVLDFILQRSSLWDPSQPYITTGGAKIRLPDGGWRLRDYQAEGSRSFTLSSESGMLIRCVPHPELTPDHDLEEELAFEYFQAALVTERLALQLAGSTLPAVQTPFVHEEDGQEVSEVGFHALFKAGGVVWHLSANGLEAQRQQLLAALAGIELPASR